MRKSGRDVAALSRLSEGIDQSLVKYFAFLSIGNEEDYTTPSAINGERHCLG
jgi:hypothetical protein